MTNGMFSRLSGLSAVFAVLLVVIQAPSSRAAEPAEVALPALVIAYHTTSANWTPFRTAWRRGALQRLQALQKEGALRSYHVLFNRYVDSASWNAMLVLEFSGATGLAHWKQSARKMPAGLTQDQLALTSEIETTPVNLVRHGAAQRSSAAPVFLVIPYRYLVSADAYLKYLDTYTIPQLKGWRDAGVLASYTIVMAQYPAGRPWSSMLLLEYRGDQGLAARDYVKSRVRAELSQDPTWKAISSDKKGIRDELAPTVADDVAAK